MSGIVSYGAHIPFYRLSRLEIGKAWGKKGGPGEKAVAGPDEDTITMAVQACCECLKGVEKGKVDGLYLATCTPPYVQKQSASIVSSALDLGEDIRSLDIGHSLRGGTTALRAALDSVNAKSARSVMVVGSDCLLAPPDSGKEMEYGDGAAALLIGDSEVAAKIEAVHSISSEFLDVWRLPGDRHNQEWEDRFIRDEGYLRLLPELVSGILKKSGLGPKDFQKVVYNAIDARSHRAVARKMGFDYEKQVQDPLYGDIGNTGTASTFMILISALEDSQPGDRILLANYGDGGDACIIEVTEQITKVRARGGLKTLLDSKMMLDSYGKYLHFRDLMQWELDRRPPPRTSLPHYFRERRQLFGLVGQRCASCGREQFPRQRICIWCQARMEKPGQYVDVPLASQKGVLFTFSMDQRAPVADLPNVLCVVDLEGGARFYGLMTDRDPARIEIGQEMEFTFRKINDAQGVHNYFWKARPMRG